MTLSQNHHYVIQHVFHLFQILKLEPNFLGIGFFHKWVEQFRQYHKVIWFVLNVQEKNVKFDKTQVSRNIRNS